MTRTSDPAAPLRPFDALSLDVGGVLLVPEHAQLARALRDADVAHDPGRFADAHYEAMHAVDEARSRPETFGDYVPAFVARSGIEAALHPAATAALGALFGPSGLWCQPIEESVAELRLLVDAGMPIVIVSNADGTVGQVLAAAGVAQVGEGPGVPVVGIVDSGAVGVAKPDPAIFDPALAMLGTTPERTLHVGDSVHYDVGGARAAGLQAAHFDPRSLCRRGDHPHVRRLGDLLDVWTGAVPAGERAR